MLGVGIGSERTREFQGFREEADVRRRGSMLDEAWGITALWSGEPVQQTGEHYQVDGVRFRATSLQRPLPIWVGAVWPGRRALLRAARWQGVFSLALPGPDAVADIRRAVGPDKDIATEGDQHPTGEWERLGATWWMRRLRSDALARDIERLIDAGPPR